VDWRSASPSIVESLGDGLFRALAEGTGTVEAVSTSTPSVVGQGTFVVDGGAAPDPSDLFVEVEADAPAPFDADTVGITVRVVNGTGPGAVEATNRVLRAQGLALPETVPVTAAVTARTHPGALVIAPPSALGTPWMKRFAPASVAFVSGWMRLRGVRRRRAADRGFVLSAHADWAGLNAAVSETGAERVFVTHGYTEVFQAWLAARGYEAAIVATEFVGESVDPATDAAEPDAQTAEAGDGTGPGPGSGAAAC